jgi:hypothetical protein
MKKIIILVFFFIALKYGWDRYQPGSVQADDLAAFANPVYAVVRFKFEARGRSFDQVVFVQAKDAADCDKFSKNTANNGLRKGWKLGSSECITDLEPRYVSLFENLPSFVTYLSLSRGSQNEREERIIYWGVSVEESDRVCGGVSQMQKERKGAATCIRALAK